MEGKDGMRALLARYHAEPGNGDTVAVALGLMAEAVARDEPACVTYHAARSVDDPDFFVLYEEYMDEAALLAHRETPHFQALIEGTIVPLLASREREILVPVVGAPDDGAGA